jgi:hypothetical protein
MKGIKVNIERQGSIKRGKVKRGKKGGRIRQRKVLRKT